MCFKDEEKEEEVKKRYAGFSWLELARRVNNGDPDRENICRELARRKLEHWLGGGKIEL